MSWGSTTSTYTEPTDYDGFMVTPTGHANVLFVAASGDTAGVLTYPAASQEVLSVGGENTDIGLNEAVQVVGAWAGGDGTGSGGGPDTIYAKPYPTPDVALDADPLTGVWVYDSSPDPADGPTIDGGWSVIGGTSFACPAWAALMTIVDQGLSARGIGPLNTEQALGFEQYDPARDDQTLDPYGIYGLMEAGIVGTGGAPNTPIL